MTPTPSFAHNLPERRDSYGGEACKMDASIRVGFSILSFQQEPSVHTLETELLRQNRCALARGKLLRLQQFRVEDNAMLATVGARVPIAWAVAVFIPKESKLPANLVSRTDAWAEPSSHRRPHDYRRGR